jgi:hypothetical protein
VYVCGICNKAIGPNTPSFLIPTRIRKRKYPLRTGANKLKDPAKPGKRRVVYKNDPGGEGYETAREVRVCAACRKNAPPPVDE